LAGYGRNGRFTGFDLHGYDRAALFPLERAGLTDYSFFERRAVLVCGGFEVALIAITTFVILAVISD
jgi:hypothetical protein